MKLFRFCRQGLTALPVFFMLMACDKLLPTSGSGELVPVKIRSVSVKGYGEASATRSAGGERRLVGEPIVQDLGGGMLAEITVEEDVSALRDDSDPKDLDDGAKFRIVALKKNTSEIYSWADYTAASSGTLDPVAGNLHVVSEVEYDFVCFSYNSTTASLPAALNEGGTLGSITVTNANDFLYKKLTAQKLNATNNTLSFTLEQQFVKAKLKLNGNGKTITDIADNSISLNAASSGNFNLAEGEFSSSGSINFSGWTPAELGVEEVTSDEITFIPKATGDYTLSFDVGAVTRTDGTPSTSTNAWTATISNSKFVAGSSYTIVAKLYKKIADKLAVSNIYWDGNQLTFEPHGGTNTDYAKYQGVFFKWGSLIGIAPTRSNSNNNAHDANSDILYVPDDITNRTWKSPTTGSACEWDSWGDIPYSTFSFPSYNSKSDRTLLNNADFTAYKGDICNYINSAYRMLTMSEWEAICSSHKFSGFTSGAITPENNETNQAGRCVFADNKCVTFTNVSTGITYTFPSSGLINTSGALSGIGRYGPYWSGSASSTGYAYFLDIETTNATTNDVEVRTGRTVRCVLNE